MGPEGQAQKLLDWLSDGAIKMVPRLRFIDAYTKSCLKEGMSLEYITEAVHVAAAIRGVASLVYAIQAHNAAERL